MAEGAGADQAQAILLGEVFYFDDGFAHVVHSIVRYWLFVICYLLLVAVGVGLKQGERSTTSLLFPSISMKLNHLMHIIQYGITVLLQAWLFLCAQVVLPVLLIRVFQ